MARVICALPNASEEIDDVKFEAVEGGMLSEEISDELAARFASIDGYKLVDGEAPKTKRGKKAKDEGGSDVGESGAQ